MRGNIVLALCLDLCSCATHRAYVGYPATDLQALTPGLSRAALELHTGAAASLQTTSSGYTATYIYDRGYVGSLEEQGLGSQIGYAPIMAWGELLTLGLLGVMLDNCQQACQKGQLIVHYNSDEHMISASAEALPLDHPLLDGCAYNTASSMLNSCLAIREMARRSTVPAEPG